MNLETAANILARDEEHGVLYGELWVENDLFDVILTEEPVLGRVRVEVDNYDSLDGGYVENHHVMAGEGSERSYAGTEDEVRLPERNDELEAYVLKALS